MPAYRPLTQLPTHRVLNQVPPLDYDAFAADRTLAEALEREGGGWARDSAEALGRLAGSERIAELAHTANRLVPELRTFDRYGQRIDEVLYHPAYHELLDLAIAHEVPSIAWTARRPGAHVAHGVLMYLYCQAEAGVCCPLAMTYAVIPSLRRQPDLAAEWEPRALTKHYDPRCLPPGQKRGATFGMAMTEKQGGSDVRANTTRARPLGGGDAGGEYLLTGHKWFCSAPMSDAFLTLATTERGLSCFLVPRWRPDQTRNPFFIQRLKDKLGNRSNASAEIEYLDTWARLVGEDGDGVRTIIDMVHHTRLEACLAPAGMIRQAVVLALHHARHRKAFGARLIEQPLMRNVLADLVLESQAATVLAIRLARSFDQAAAGERDAARFARLATAIGKYWINKRAIRVAAEALECLGGAGYVEESPLPRLYREAPLNGIWEGSGNVICLDVLRTLAREPTAAESYLAELAAARGADRRLDALIPRVEAALTDRDETHARSLVELLARALEASLLVRHAPAAIADAYCASRLTGERLDSYGTLPGGVDLDGILRRAWE